MLAALVSNSCASDVNRGGYDRQMEGNLRRRRPQLRAPPDPGDGCQLRTYVSQRADTTRTGTEVRDRRRLWWPALRRPRGRTALWGGHGLPERAATAANCRGTSSLCSVPPR